jgi:hypothetical protein
MAINKQSKKERNRKKLQKGKKLEAKKPLSLGQLWTLSPYHTIPQP